MLGFYLSLIDEPDDKEKFAEIFRSYGNMMFSKAMSVLHNTALAEEAVQESFLKIAKNISKISEPNCSKTADSRIYRGKKLLMTKLEELYGTEKSGKQ